MVTAIVGGLIGWAFAGAGIITGITVFQAVMIGMSLGSLVGGLISGQSASYDSSPTYSFGSISNTMSQNVPIPVIYGGEMRVAGNIIYQAFDSDEKKVQKMYVLISEGEVESISSVMANDSAVTELSGCSLTVYTNTTSATADSRDPSGTRPYPNNIAMVCLTLKASEQLSGTPTITSIVKGVKIWTPSGKVWSDNPIWCAVDLLANPRYGLGICTYDASGNYDHPDWDRIDYASALSAANYCDGTVSGEKRFRLTYVLDTQMAIKDALTEILNTCRGFMVETDKIEFHIDAPVSNYTREITQGHIVEGSFTWWQKTSEDQFNQFTVDWCDPDSSYDRVTDVFQDSTDIATRGIVTNSVQLLGITRSTQVGRMGAYLLKTSLLVRNLCSFNVGIQDFDILPGEVIAITYPSFTGWNKKWFRVISTKPVDDLQMTVTAAEYVAECYDDSTMTVVAHIDTQRSKDYTPKEVTGLTVTEEVTVAADGQYINTAIASWTVGSNANSIQVWYRFDNDAYYTMAATLSAGSTEYRLDCTTHSVVYFKIVSVTSIGKSSSGVVVRHAITGDTTAPAAPTNLSGAGGYKLANVKWTDPSDNDLNHIDIYRSTDGTTYAVAGQVTRGTQAFIDANLGILTTYWYKLKAVDNADNESVFSDVTTVTTEAIPMSEIPDYSIDGHKTVTDIFGDSEDTANAVVEQVLNNYNDNTQEGVKIREVKEVLDDVTGRWYVKIDNNKRVAGLSLYNGSEDSNFTVLADKFFIYGTGTSGSEVKQIFAVDTTTGKVVLQGDLLADGSITGAMINATAKIQLGSGGQLLMGTGSVLQMSSGAVVLDSENGVLQIKDPNNLTTGDYIRIETGDITTYKYINGYYRAMKSLRDIRVGTVTSGTRVTLENLPSMPSVMTSLKSIQTYDGEATTQQQSIEAFIENSQWTASTGTYAFTPHLRLTRRQTAQESYSNVLASTFARLFSASQLSQVRTQSYTYQTGASTVTIPINSKNITITGRFVDFLCCYIGYNNLFFDMATTNHYIQAYIGGTLVGATTVASTNRATSPTYYANAAWSAQNTAGQGFAAYWKNHRTTPFTISISGNPSAGGTIYLKDTATYRSGVEKTCSYSSYDFVPDIAYLGICIDTITYDGSGATVIDTGEINYMAIAE